MSRLARPHIPLRVRVLVAERQVIAKRGVCFVNSFGVPKPAADFIEMIGAGRALKMVLAILCPDGGYHLDHDPALGLRPYNKRTKRYTPDANDPDFLIYRAKEDHGTKTFTKNGHQRGDVPEMRHRRQLSSAPEKWVSKAPGLGLLRRKAKRKKSRFVWPKRKMRGRVTGLNTA